MKFQPCYSIRKRTTISSHHQSLKIYDSTCASPHHPVIKFTMTIPYCMSICMYVCLLSTKPKPKPAIPPPKRLHHTPQKNESGSSKPTSSPQHATTRQRDTNEPETDSSQPRYLLYMVRRILGADVHGFVEAETGLFPFLTYL